MASVRKKYRNEPTLVDGQRFDSRLEARRWQQLQLLARAGHIYHLQCQVRFPLTCHGSKIGSYVADFVYATTDTPPVLVSQDAVHLSENAIVEDTKGIETPLFKWKAKHFHAQYGHQIQRVRK